LATLNAQRQQNQQLLSTSWVVFPFEGYGIANKMLEAEWNAQR